MKHDAFQHPTHYAVLIPIVLVAAWGPVASGNQEYQSCEISYQYTYQAGDRADTSTSERTARACVESLSACHNRAVTLAREDARRREGSTDDPGRVDMASIRVVDTTIEGSCDRLD